PRLGPGIHYASDQLNGKMFPQPTLNNGQLMDDIIGPYKFALIGNANLINDNHGYIKNLYQLLDVVLITDTNEEVKKWLKKYKVQAVIIRPDRYIYASATNSKELDEIVHRLITTISRRDVNETSDLF